MGKRPLSPSGTTNLRQKFSDGLKSAKITDRSPDSTRGGVGVGGAMDGSPATTAAAGAAERRVPLGDVVGDCVRRWFQDTLKEARNGDTAMQVLVGQMYRSGYGVPRNDSKANSWITKASKYRSSVRKVSDKRPGYNASDSDSDEEEDGNN